MLEDTCTGNKLIGMFRGKVLQHLPHGYCKVMVYGVYPPDWETQPDLIPPAEQASPLFAGSYDGNGVFSYPNIGATVWCWFANGDQNLPVYFASALGGENAFGQHELVKLSEEEVSPRHLVTSGKTHIEWYESGKLSAIVEDPIRTAASVDFDTQAVSQRDLQDKVSAEEISNLNCQLVLDNEYARGTVSCSTHFYCPTSEHIQSALTSATDTSSIVENSDGEESFDSMHVTDNGMVDQYSAISCFQSSYNKNVTIAGSTRESSEQKVKSSDIQSSNAVSTDCNNNFVVSLKHEKSLQDSYTYVENKPTKSTVMTALVFEDEFEGTLALRDDATAGIGVLSSSNKILENNGSTSVEKQDLDNKLQVNGAEGILLQAKQDTFSEHDGQVTIKKNCIAATGSNAGTAECKFSMSGYKSMNGTDVVNAQFERLESTSDGLVSQTFVDKIKKVQHSKVIQSKDGSVSEVLEDKERKVVASNVASTSDGSVVITIQDNQTGKMSKITLGKDGQLKLEASTKITLTAPNIEIEGITHITGVTTIDSATTIKSSLTTIGDATIKGSSYTGHVHQYILPTYPAGPSSTTPRT